MNGGENDGWMEGGRLRGWIYTTWFKGTIIFFYHGEGERYQLENESRGSS